MKELSAIPLLSLILVLQTAVLSRTPLMGGYADLMLVVVSVWAMQEQVKSAWLWAIFGGLLVGWASALPVLIPVAGYLLIVALARFMVRRIWQAPLIANFILVFFGSLIMHIISIFVLQLLGTPLPFAEALRYITIPSLILNLILAFPAYPILRDLAVWIYGVEEDE